MFNGIMKSDDVEVYEGIPSMPPMYISLQDNCKSNHIFELSAGSNAYVQLPNISYIGKTIRFHVIYGQLPTGKQTQNAPYILIQHSNTTLFTLRSGMIEFMYVGQALNGLTATDKAKSGWIILGGVQGDTAITGHGGSVAIGSGASCSATSTVSIGQNTSASGAASICVGSSSNSGGNQSLGLGNSINAGQPYSVAIGYLADARSSKLVFKANNQFSATQDAQAGKFILMRQTTDAAPTVMSATNAAASTTNILILPNTSAYSFIGKVVARDASTGDCAMWTITALMRRGANASTTALVGTPTVTKVFNDAGATAWSITLTADTTNGGGTITVTGEAGKTIRWVSNIDSAEVM